MWHCAGAFSVCVECTLVKMAHHHGEASGSRTKRKTAEQLVNLFMGDDDSDNDRFDIGDESGSSEDEVLNDSEWEYESEDEQSDGGKSPASSPGKLAFVY